jgi:hypothetical protein
MPIGSSRRDDSRGHDCKAARDRRCVRLSGSTCRSGTVPHRPSRALSRLDAARAPSGSDRTGRDDPRHLQRCGHRCRPRRRQHELLRRRHAERGRKSGRPVAVADAQDPARRCCELHPDRGRWLPACGSAGRRCICRSAVPDEPRIGGLVSARRQSFDERGRHRRTPLRNDARPGPRSRSRAAGRTSAR